MADTDLIERLKSAAEKATPGPWAVDGYSTDAVIFMPAGKSHVSDWRCVLKCATADGNWRQNAAYVALCSPDNILSLISELTTSRAECEGLRAALMEMERASHIVLCGLNARIDTAPSNAKPVFSGIADLHDTLSIARAALSQKEAGHGA